VYIFKYRLAKIYRFNTNVQRTGEFITQVEFERA